MKVHANAPLGPKGRATMVLRVLEEGWSLAEAAEAAGVSERIPEIAVLSKVDLVAPDGRLLPGGFMDERAKADVRGRIDSSAEHSLNRPIGREESLGTRRLTAIALHSR